MTLKVDMQGIQEGFKPVPAGTYVFTVTNMEMKQTGPDSKKYPNEDMLNYELTISEGEYEGRKLFYNCIIHPNLLGNLKALGRCSGKFTEEEMEGVWELEEDGAEFIGTQGKAIVTVKPFGGDQVNNVKRIMPLSEEDVTESSLLP